VAGVLRLPYMVTPSCCQRLPVTPLRPRRTASRVSPTPETLERVVLLRLPTPSLASSIPVALLKSLLDLAFLSPCSNPCSALSGSLGLIQCRRGGVCSGETNTTRGFERNG
jgi:hypothetical protein